jgi:hypothetical protein
VSLRKFRTPRERALDAVMIVLSVLLLMAVVKLT